MQMIIVGSAIVAAVVYLIWMFGALAADHVACKPELKRKPRSLERTEWEFKPHFGFVRHERGVVLRVYWDMAKFSGFYWLAMDLQNEYRQHGGICLDEDEARGLADSAAIGLIMQRPEPRD